MPEKSIGIDDLKYEYCLLLHNNADSSAFWMLRVFILTQILS